MSSYLKSLGLHVYLATTKKSYVGNGKYLRANAQAIDALKHIFSKEHISLISHCDSTFAVLNTLIFLKKQAQHILERESRSDVSEQTCYMVQGNNSLEIISDTQLDDCASSSCDDNSMDAHANVLNEELSLFCENLLEKYKLLKKKF